MLFLPSCPTKLFLFGRFTGLINIELGKLSEKCVFHVVQTSNVSSEYDRIRRIRTFQQCIYILIRVHIHTHVHTYTYSMYRTCVQRVWATQPGILRVAHASKRKPRRWSLERHGTRRSSSFNAASRCQFVFEGNLIPRQLTRYYSQALIFTLPLRTWR